MKVVIGKSLYEPTCLFFDRELDPPNSYNRGKQIEEVKTPQKREGSHSEQHL